MNEFSIIDKIATLFGFLMKGIFLFLEKSNIPSIALSIIIFTFITNIIIWPINFKQQKSNRLLNLINPEIKRINLKYKGKIDEISIAAKQVETKRLYEKYGISNIGSLITVFIQLPIIWALYRVIYNIPEYIKITNIENYSYFLGLNISNSPSFMITKEKNFLAILIPLFSVIIPYICSQITTKTDSKKLLETDAAKKVKKTNLTSNIMSLIFIPISFIFSFKFPIGVSLYWIAGAIINLITSIITSKILNKTDFLKQIQKKKEKEQKLKQKYLTQQKNLNLKEKANLVQNNLKNN